MAARNPARKGFLVRLGLEERQAVEAAAEKAGLQAAVWARGVLVSSAQYDPPALVVPLSKLDAARVALEAGERKAAPLGRPLSLDAPAVRCSRHKVLSCHRCAP